MALLTQMRQKANGVIGQVEAEGKTFIDQNTLLVVCFEFKNYDAATEHGYTVHTYSYEKLFIFAMHSYLLQMKGPIT